MFLKIAVKFIVAGRFSCPPKKSAATFLKTAKKKLPQKNYSKKNSKKKLNKNQRNISFKNYHKEILKRTL
jgi:hypothetical protein